MKPCILILLFLILLVSCTSAPEKDTSTVPVKGLPSKVEIHRDEHGINYIFAKSQHNLFLAKGYAAARVRLFQFEIWR